MAGDRTLRNLTVSRDSLPPGITPVQAKTLGSLLAGGTISSAARAAGVTRQTAHKWLSDDAEFLAFYNSCSAYMISSINQQLFIMSGPALRAIRGIIRRRSTPDAVRLRAAAEVLRLVSGPVEGPTEVEAATDAIALRKKRQGLDHMMARLGVDRQDVLDHLSRPADEDLEDEVEIDNAEDLEDEVEDDDGVLDRNGPLSVALLHTFRDAIRARIDSEKGGEHGDRD